MASEKTPGKQMQNTTIKVRLYPSPGQAELLDKTFGCCRYIWNQMLSDQGEFYAATGVHFLPTPAKYKKAAPFLKEVDSSALATVHQNLRRAFQLFFDQPHAYRHPVFKKKKAEKQSYTTYRSTQSANIYLTNDGVRLPKLGIVKAKLHRKPLHWWTLKSATVSKTRTGKYFCSLLFAYPVKQPEAVLPAEDTTLGLNYSMSHFYVDSNGKEANPPHWLAKSQKKLAAMQQRLSRMEYGSNHYRQQLRKIQLLHEHIANQRKDFVHKESRRIANAYDAVCVRDFDLTAASQALHLGNVMDSGFGKFRICLEYKLARQGKQYILVDKSAPTTKTCHCCGAVNEQLSLPDRTWHCPSCGAIVARATNAAKNIKDWGIAQFYEAQKVRRSA